MDQAATIEYVMQSASPLFFPLLTAIGAFIAARRSQRKGGSPLETWIQWWLAGAVVAGALWVGVSFLLAPDYMAQSIGFGTGSPFQLEVAWSNIGFALMGFLAIRLFKGARFPLAVGYAAFLWGATYGHLHDWVTRGNTAPGNTGGILVYDVVIPVVLLVLVVRQLRQRGAPVASPRHA